MKYRHFYRRHHYYGVKPQPVGFLKNLWLNLKYWAQDIRNAI